ncbi:MAG: hypothetical protein RLZZ378_49, partial [Actinomycetota bacterium]
MAKPSSLPSATAQQVALALSAHA